jgi:hypothetical protein
MAVSASVRLIAASSVLAVLLALLVAPPPVVAEVGSPVLFEPGEPRREAVGVSASEVQLPAASTERPVPVGEVVDRRSERSKVWRMSDGTMALQVAGVPLHVRDASGAWMDVDPQVEPSGGGFVSDGVPVELSLPAAATGVVSLSDATGTVGFRVVQLGSGAAAVPPRDASAVEGADGRSVGYDEVAAGVEVVYEPFVAGVKESVVLADVSAPRTVVFEVTGARAVSDGSGVALVDGSGVARWRVAPPFMTDATGARSEGVSVTVDAAGRLVQTVTDTAWLESADRVWPVTVDPTLSATSIVTDCQLHQDAPLLTDCGSASAIVGNDGTGEHRMVLRFDVAREFDEPVQVINDAWVGLTRTTTDPGAGTAPIEVAGLSAEFNVGAVSWTNRAAGTAPSR